MVTHNSNLIQQSLCSREGRTTFSRLNARTRGTYARNSSKRQNREDMYVATLRGRSTGDHPLPKSLVEQRITPTMSLSTLSSALDDPFFWGGPLLINVPSPYPCTHPIFSNGFTKLPYPPDGTSSEYSWQACHAPYVSW